MHIIFKNIKKILLVIVVSAMMISQLELFANVYAVELEKITDKSPYGELYDTDINNVNNENAVIMESADPDVITKEPVVEHEVTNRTNEKEIVDLRTENTKTYKLGSGEYVTDFYFEPIHKKEKGKFVEIDNNIEKKTSLFRTTPSYENKDGLYDFSIKDGVLDIEDSDGNELTLMPSGKLENYAIKGNVILYSEITKNMDLEYRINSNTIQHNVYINGELESNEYTFEIVKGKYSVNQNEAGDIVFSKDKKDVYILNAPYLVDKDGQRNQEIKYNLKEQENGKILVTMTFNEEWLKADNRVFPVAARANVEVGNIDVIDLNSSYIRSGMPNIQSQYSDLFVGYDDDFYGGAGSNIKIARTFIYFDMPDIGENQRIENAVLKLYKEQDLDYANELNDINVYNTNYVNPSTVTWNNQPSNKQLISNNKFTKPKGFKDFDITKHVQELQKGQKKTLVLQVTDESSKWNANVFNSESTGNLPKVEIYHCDDFDVDPNLDINIFDNELRVYAKDGQYFEAISMDGIAKPNSDLKFDLYAKVNDTDFEFIKTQNSKDKSSPYFVDPIYVTNPIDGTQKYEKGEVNYTTNYLRIGEIPKYDTFYEYRMKVVNNGTESEKELITDGFIIYKVKLGDSIKSIASHYGLKIEDIKKDNNTNTNKIKEGDVLFLRFAKNNPKVPKDVYRPPIKLSSFEAKYVYRGPACFGNCSAADPVNTSIGNFFHESKDFTLTDFDELSLNRVYNSYGDDNASIFGTNFSSNFEQYVAYDKDDNMLFFRGDGKILKIDKKDGKYSPRLVDRLSVKVDGDYVTIYDERTEQTYVFDEYGTLSIIKTKTGFENKIIYDDYGWIKEVQIGEKKVTFEYNDYHLVSKINLPNNTSINYVYNNDRQLVEFIDAAGNSEKYAYDDHGKIKNITDKNGNVLANNTYTDEGVVTSQTDANGNKVDFSYDGNTTSVTYNDKETEKYVLDDNYKVTKITKGDGSSKSYAYNESGRMISETDEKGRKTTYEYDSKGNLTLQKNPDGTTEKYTYDANSNMTSKTSADGKVETYKYDSNNNLIYKDTGEILKTSYEYNDKNLVIKETNSLGVSKSYEYAGNQITKITHSNGLVETFVYDVMGNVTKESDSNGRSTTYVYDNLNQIIKKTDSYGNSESFKYDGNGNVIEYIDKLGGKTLSTYDKNNNLIGTSKGTLKTSKKYDNHNRLVSETDEQGLTTKYSYDTKGQKISETDAYGNKTTYEYDEIGNLVKTTDGKGNITLNEYKDRNVVKTTDSRGNITTFEYDQFNRVVKVALPTGKTQITEYDNNGNIIKTINERGLINTKEYDQYNRLVKEVNEQGVVISNSYDIYNQLIKKIEDKKTTTYTYDVYGNQLTETNTYGGTKKSEYDKLDRLVKSIDELGYTTTYKYDAADHEIEVIDANGHSEKKIYDVNSILVQDIDKLGNITTYKYNDLGYQVEAIDAYKNVTKYEYDKYGNVLKTYINDTLIESNTYDKFGRKIKIDSVKEVISTEYDKSDLVVKTNNETTGLVTTNEYDKFGNVIKTSDNGGKTETKKYDQFNQVIEETDAYGRIAKIEYDKFGQVVKEISATNEVTSTTYDKYGNVTKVVTPLESSTVSTYDLLNRKLTDTIDGKKTLTYTYDAKGQNVSIHDSFTDKTDLSKYDGMGQVIETTDKLGNISKTEYDAKGQIIKTTDALGNTRTKEYDLYGNIIKETNALGHSKQTKYNALGLVIQEVDERGFSTSYKYNDKFQPVEVVDKLGKSAKFEYNTQGYIAKAINQNGFETTFEYDLYGQTIKETDPNGNVKTNEYDLLGNVIKSTEPNRKTIHKYDDLGRLTSTNQNGKNTVTNTYNELNQIVKSTNALGYSTEYEYDIYGNTTKEKFVDHVTVKTYDINSQLTKTVENVDKTTLYEYDVLGRETKQTLNGRDILVQKYDALGNALEKTEKGVTLQFVYDAEGQVIKHNYPELDNENQFKTIVSIKYDETGNQVEFKDVYDNVLKRTYDANNNVVSETNTRGYTTRYEYDSLSNITKVQTPLERVVKYEYDGNSNMLKRIYNDKEATYTYDANNNLISEISEYGLKESYEYDNDGNMVSLTKNDGTQIKYSYDALGRKTGEGNREFEYDPYDNVTKATYNNKAIEYTYDNFNNITKVNDANENIIEYKWDLYGNRTELKYKDNTIKYTYNQFDKIDKVLKDNEEYASYSYDVRGNTSSVVRNGITTNYNYDELNRRIKYVNTKDDKTLSTYEYSYDGENNIISETINGNKNSYTYNESDELKTSSKTIDGKVIKTEYQYDLFGNKIETASNGDTKVYRYNDKNQLTSIKTKEGLTDIYYNKNGNIRDIYYAGGYKEYYEYDEFNQLITLKSNKDRKWNYEYDAEGDRIGEEKIISNKFELDYEDDSEEWYDYVQTLPFDEVKELLDEKNSDETFDALRYQLKYRKNTGLCVSNLVKEADGEDCTNITYVLDKTVEDALILSSGDDFNIYGEERISTESEQERLTYISALNQSVMQNVKEDLNAEDIKQTLFDFDYDDAGMTTDIKSGFAYNGEKLDETGNIYLRARYYNPRIGQFVQIDSNRGNQQEVATQNRYTYVANNQYKYVDSNGNIFGFIKKAVNTVVNTATKVVKGIVDTGKKIVNTVINAGKNLVNTVVNAVTGGNSRNKNKQSNSTAKIDDSTNKNNTSGKNKSSNSKATKVEPEPCPAEKLKNVNGALDAIQTLISIVGFIPFLGDIADVLNGFISYLRGNYLDAIIDIGSAVLSTIGDTLLKPIRWAKSKLDDALFEVLKKCPNITKMFKKGVNAVANTVDDCWLIPSKVKQWVNKVANNVNKYVDDLFAGANRRKKATQLEINKVVGRNFELEKLDEMRKKYGDVSEQITVVVKNPIDGKEIKFRIDGASGNYDNPILREFKSSDTAPLTTNQEYGFDLFKKYGGEIRGAGKPPNFPGGKKMPPTFIKVIRPGDNV